MNNIVSKAITWLLVALLACFGMYLLVSGTKPLKTQIPRSKAKVVISTSIKEHSKAKNQEVMLTKTIQVNQIPRTGVVEIDITPKGEVVVAEQPWINTCLVPTIGMEVIPWYGLRVGVQILRSEPIGVGISVGLSTQTLSLTLDKDLYSNILTGIGVGISKDGLVRAIWHISLFI